MLLPSKPEPSDEPMPVATPPVAIAGPDRVLSAGPAQILPAENLPPEIQKPEREPQTEKIEGAEAWKRERELRAEKWRALSLSEAEQFAADRDLSTETRGELLGIIEQFHDDRAATSLDIEEGRLRMPAGRDELWAHGAAFDEALDRLLGAELADAVRMRLVEASKQAVGDARR